VFESLVPHKIRHLGVSNFSLDQLRHVCDGSTVRPVIVQNRFVRETSYDGELRGFCREHGITYQAFGMLRHSPEILESDLVQRVAGKLGGCERELALYVLILSLGGVQVLNGTTKAERMQKDLEVCGRVFGDAKLYRALKKEFSEWPELLRKLAGSA